MYIMSHVHVTIAVCVCDFVGVGVCKHYVHTICLGDTNAWYKLSSGWEYMYMYVHVHVGDRCTCTCTCCGGIAGLQIIN